MSEQRATAIEPVRCQVTVRCDPARAFEAFTAEMGRWWPTETHAIEPDRAVDVVVERRVGGRVLERLDDGTEYEWAEITAWDPPSRLGLSWHPQVDFTVSTDIDIRFVDRGDGTTTVELTHTGWERLVEPAGARTSYDTGWQLTFARYADHANGA